MSTISQAESRRLYSWWWASHISPKNSKWLQEDLTDKLMRVVTQELAFCLGIVGCSRTNCRSCQFLLIKECMGLTPLHLSSIFHCFLNPQVSADMDSRVKSMIKLIEEDADSFAKRAEMYYKKRPELMKLVEEFYRAYRALAERYDHATRALRQAHRTMAETFPDQISFAAADDSPSASSPAESEPCTPEMPSFMHVMFSPDDLHKEASNLSPQFMTSKRSGTYAGEPEIFAGKKGLKQVHEMFGSPDGATNSKYSEGRARKGLNFREENVKSSESKLHVELGSSGKHGSKEDALEKERTLLDEISQLSSEIETLRKQVNTEAENASYCKAEAERLQEINLKLGSDKDNTAVFYQQALKKISDFEADINNFRNLKLELLKKDQELNISVEKYLVLDSENQVLRSEIDELKREVSDLSEGLQLKQEDYKKLEFSLREKNMHLMQAEAAVGSLKELHSQSQKELEMCKLEKEIAVEKLKHVEVKLQSLEEELCHDEKAFEQNEMELEELKVAIEDAQLQSVQAEVDIQTFKELYIQTIDELKVTSLEMQRGAQMLKNTELKKQALEEDAFQIKTENAKLSRKLKEMRDEMDDMKLSVKVEHARNLQVEKALECLKESYAQSQEELRLLSLDRENGVQMLRNMELRNQNLEEEILGVKEENNYLSTEMVQKRKELEELKIILQDEQSRSAQVEVSYETMKEKYAQAQEELGSLLSEWQKEAQMLKSDQLKQETFEKEIQQLREENHNKCHELELTKEESKKLKIFLENVQLQSVQTEVDLEIMKKLQTESQEKLIVLLEERDKEAQVLKSIEFQKSILEEKVQKLKTDNDNQRLDIEQNQEELHKLKLFIKDEQLRSVQTEATLDSLKKLYAESQEELRFSLKERENEVQILKNIKQQRQTLEKEIQQVKEKNDSQIRELEEKQKELEKLKSFLQEDHLQLQKTEADLESFKELLHDSREELKLLLEEKQNEGHIQQSVELQKHALEEEIQQLNDEKANQSKELEQNQQELNKLKLCLEAEKLQEMQTEAALESLKKLYTESQDELKLSSQERQNVIQMLKDVELKKQVMGEEFQLVVQEKIDLNEKLVRMRKELKELNIVIENERLGVMQAEIALAYIRDLYYRSQDVLCIASLGRQKEIQILEEKNQALKENIQQNEEENCKLKGELHQNQRKLEKLKASIEIEQLRSADIEGALNSLERLYADTQEELKVVSLERQNQVQLLASLELKNKSRDEENCKLISELNKQFQQLEELHIFLKEEKLHSEQVHAEFDHLKKLYNQSREELNIASMEIKHNIQMLRDVEFQKQALEKEMLLVKEENGNMKQGLHDKQEEIERLHISIQDEHLHSLQEEVALKSLKELYFQSQNELKILTLNVKKKDQLLEELGLRKQYLEDEVTRVEKEMQDLSKRNIVSLSIIKNLQGETIIFKEKNIKLENELQLHKNEKKALQLEICCLQEQLNDLEQKHKCITGQLEATGLDANSLQSSVETLRNENSMLKSTCEKQENEKVLFLGKLADMHMLSERNATLANSLSDAMFELEGLREKLHTSENSCVILQESNAVLISENSSLISKICSIMENTEEIVEKNVFFENSLYVASLELEEMRGKLRCFEEICRVICDEKANLQRENNTLLSQVECFDNSLKILEEKYAELHEKCSFLEGEKDLAQKMVCELQILLDTEKANKENTLHSNRDKLACLDHQIDLLNEEVQHKEEVITNKENELLALLFEIFIFQRCLHDLHDINLVVSGDCHQLGQEVQKQQKIVGSLSEQIKKLKKRILSMWMSLNPEMGCFVDADYELLCQSIQDKVIELQDYCSELEDEKHRQLLDKMVILMLLHHQIGLDVVDLKLDRSSLDQHCRIMDSELLLLHGEKRDILEMNGQIRHELEESYQREEILKAEMEILCRLLTNLRMDYDISENTNRKLIEKNRILSAKFEHVMKERARLDKDLSHALEEVAVLDCLSLIFKQSSEEWANNLVFTNKELNSLRKSNDGQEQNLKETAVMLHIFEAENLKLYEGLISRLHEYYGQLTILKKNVSIVGDSSKLLNNQVDELKLQIEDRNVLLSQKKLEASEAYMKVHAMQDENAEIQSSLLGARKELDMTNAVRGQLEDKVSALSENFRKGTEELYAVLEDNRHLHADLLKLQNENRKLRTKEQLASRLSKELEYCEAEFIVLANDSQLAGILALLFEEKVFELWKLLKSIEIRSIVEKNALIEELTRRHTHINMLKKNIINLEEENSLLKVEQDNWHPVISSLWRSILNLENYGHKTGKLRGFHNHVIMDDHILTHENENCIKLSASKANMEFQNLVSKLEALLNNLMESESHLVQTRSNLNSRSENCMHDTGPSASESRVGTGRRANAKSHDHIQPKEDCRLQKESGKEVNKRDELISKDIQLDHISHSTQTEASADTCGCGAMVFVESEDQMLELWETAEMDCKGQALNVPATAAGNNLESRFSEPEEEEKSEYTSSEIIVEKELGVDKLEIPNNERNSSSHDDQKNVLERLSSDAKRLIALQTSALELKRKLQMFENANHPKDIEYFNVKEQLKQVEDSMTLLVDVNEKLMRKARRHSHANGDSNVHDTEDMLKQRRLVSERAWRATQKIRKLELDLQKIQYVMHKLEEETERRRTATVDKKTRVLLSDYLFGKKDGRRKRRHFCGCVRTKDDCYV